MSERLPYPCRVGEGGEPWVKAQAVMPAIEASSAEIVVVHDADVWCPRLVDAVRAVEQGAAWAMPHAGVFRLSEGATVALYGGAAWESLPLEERAYKGWEGGGCVVLRREDALRVPLDPRFVGWGDEDASWAMALRCLVGPLVRIPHPLIHLYHPPQPRRERGLGSAPSLALHRRYAAARLNPGRMSVLIEEAKRDLDSHQSRLQADPALGHGLGG